MKNKPASPEKLAPRNPLAPAPRRVLVSWSTSMWRSFWIVAPTYVLAVCGSFIAPSLAPPDSESLSPVAGAFTVVLFTVTHGIVPIFFYRLFLPGQLVKSPSPIGIGCFSGFAHFHMFFWYGIPIAGLAAMTYATTVPWGMIHIIVAEHGRRRWVFLQYGSTALAVLLFLVIFPEQLFPWGLIVVVMQTAILGLIDRSGIWNFDNRAKIAASNEAWLRAADANK